MKELSHSKTAAKSRIGMHRCLSCMTARTADESDLFQIADIASLLSDGVALLVLCRGR
ncbi:hypothetical protein RBU55_21655 [Pseudomonas chlororaphis subsp. aurantiaca]|uniref:hypothetical protein n=1 Tax=Pseudomonas chlororaphis TaxID=587753 RepID=UPI0018F87D4C|nr:hypothetical protein [Pseudomonas chlororaphis]WMI98156.1 hypothetical protein RBU55_21655 [Pseudomonas chlororaphis subsp. aurantiaca]